MSSHNLVRKQYLMVDEQVSKVDRLAKKDGTSSAQIIRLAVDAYDPDEDSSAIEHSELMQLVSARLREAITDTRNTRRKLDKTLSRLGIK